MPPRKSKPTPSRQRAKLVPISDDMRHWSALLQSELASWPGVVIKPMFGMRGFYRAKRIFAALPHTRCFAGNSFILKFDPCPPSLSAKLQSETRVEHWPPRHPGNWVMFRLDSEADLRDALQWLELAYQAAASRKRR